MLSLATLLSPGTKQANVREDKFCRKTSLSLLERGERLLQPQLHSHRNAREKAFVFLPGFVHAYTPLHTSAKNHFVKLIYKCFMPCIELTSCKHKHYNKLQHVCMGQKAEYQITEIAQFPSLFIVFL